MVSERKEPEYNLLCKSGGKGILVRNRFYDAIEA